MSTKGTAGAGDGLSVASALADKLVGVRLVDWYLANHEPLPWRARADDPYAVWVAEVMLQQTQVQTVIPYYHAWMARFATVEALAAASLEDVFRLWQGLGYYGRARRLHEAARVIVGQHGGILPRTAEELRRLPGIGRYTAAAIACITLGDREPPIDTNALRVLARIEGWEVGSVSAKLISDGEEAWLRMVPDGRSAHFAQAVMDLGRSICTPTNPRCAVCPVSDLCRARANQAIIQCTPRRLRTERVRQAHVSIVACDGGRVLVRRRPDGVLWAGLWEFPRCEAPSDGSIFEVAASYAEGLLGCRPASIQALRTIRHAVTRYDIALHGYLCRSGAVDGCRTREAEGCTWVAWEDVLTLPMPSPQARLRRLAEEAGAGAAK